MAVLIVENLRKSFRGPDGQMRQVVDVPRFELAEGGQVALVGRSGGGKTTFLNLIAGILEPDAGSIRLAETEIQKLSEPRRDRFRAENLGYVFQTFNLLQGYTALENVLLGMAFGGRPDAAQAMQLLKVLGLESHAGHRPAQLSVGQQQRVAVARALANRPRLVLADEPTGNLDPQTAQAAMDLIRRVCRDQGAALLVVSHDPQLIGGFEQVEDLARINRAGQPVEAAS